MKMDCCVVRDLLPLYVENMVSDQTAEQIKQHLAECPDCQNECDSFRDNSKLDIHLKIKALTPTMKQREITASWIFT